MCRETTTGRVAFWATLALSLTGLTACGGGERAGGGAQELTRIDACNLMTKAEVEAALGSTVDEPTKHESEQAYGPEGAGRLFTTQCYWSGQLPAAMGLVFRQSGPGGKQVTSLELASDLNESLDKAGPDEAALFGDARWDPIDLSGHAAAALPIADAGWNIMVREGGRSEIEFTLSVPTREMGVELARTILSRLPSP